jgi:hypothetical protein
LTSSKVLVAFGEVAMTSLYYHKTK